MKTKKLRPVATLDFETDPFEHGKFETVFACGFFDGKTYRQKWGKERDVLKWAVKLCREFPGIIYAHNGGKFDFVGHLFKVAGSTIWGETAEMRGNRLVRMKFGQGELRDSYAILPAPLRAFGGKLEIKLWKLKAQHREKHRAEISDYLKADCQSLHDLVTRFHEVHGQAPLTAAQAGMRALSAMGLKPDSLDANLDERFRKWYYGGRCEAIRSGIHEGEFDCFDLNSAYPAAMTHDHATGNEFELLTTDEFRGSDFVLWRGRGGRHLPYRAPDGSLDFTGSDEVREYRVTGWEYLEAKRLKLIVGGKVELVWRPKRTTNFKPYVDEFFRQKQEAEDKGDKAWRQVSKIFLNAVYGKFAQRADGFKELLIVAPNAEMSDDESEAGWAEQYCDEENNFAVWSRPSSRPHTFYNVATAASITGLVRSWLMRAIVETGAYYCDTDCVYIDKGKSPTNVGKGLGQWKLEASGTELLIAGKKLYGFKRTGKFKTEADRWKMAVKGARLTPKELRKVCEGKTVKYFAEAPSYSLLSKKKHLVRKIKSTVKSGI